MMNSQLGLVATTPRLKHYQNFLQLWRTGAPPTRLPEERRRKKEKRDKNEGKCFRCKKVGHNSRSYHKKNGKNENGEKPVDIAMVTVDCKDFKVTGNSLKSNKWMLDVCCSKPICKNRTKFLNRVECAGFVLAGNKEGFPFYRVQGSTDH